MNGNDILAPREQQGARRQQILDAAAALFAERGYHGASMSDIGERVGMLKGSLYAHIANKEELLLQLVSMSWRRRFDAVAPALSGSTPAADRLRHGFHTTARLIADDPNAAAVLQRESRHLAGQPALWHADTGKRYAGMWAATVRDGVEQGEFRTGLDVEAVTILALAADDALLLSASDSGDMRDMADRLCDVLLKGCVP
jgi:AcrR family transcriptional regulator